MPATSSLDLDRSCLRARLRELFERTGNAALGRLGDDLPPVPGADFASERTRRDWLGTSLMQAFQDTGDPAVMALLFDLYAPVFRIAIRCHLRRSYHNLDADDLLQDVFLNLCRYPHCFRADRADAFRNWSHRIVRNVVLRAQKGASRGPMRGVDESQEHADERIVDPARNAADREVAPAVNVAWLLYLQLYLAGFAALSPREQKALTRVEIEGADYATVAAELGLRRQSLKMVMFRARRKIDRHLAAALQDLTCGRRARASRRSPR